jgi:thymidylate kinase
MMIIEILGLPGVGKTTVINKNRSEIDALFKVVESRKYTLINSLLTRYYYHTRFKQLTSDKALAQKIAYRMSFRTMRRGDKNLFYFDSGVAQLFFESLIAANFKNIDEINTIIDKTTMPDALVYLKDNVERVVERELARPERRFTLNRSELSERYSKVEELIEKKVLFPHKTMYMVTIDNFMDKLRELK